MRDMLSLFQGRWPEGLTPLHSPRHGAWIFYASFSHNPLHKHPPKELWGRAAVSGEEKPQAWGSGRRMDAPSARRRRSSPRA